MHLNRNIVIVIWLKVHEFLFNLLADKIRALQKEKVIPRQRIKFAIFNERMDQLAAF